MRTFHDAGVFSMIHHFGNGRNDRLSFSVTEDGLTSDGFWRLRARASDDDVSIDVPRGRNVAFEINYDDNDRTAIMSYDLDIDDNVPPMTFGPLQYGGAFVAEEHRIQLNTGASWTARANGVLERWEVLPLQGNPGDYNGNGIFDTADIDRLSEQVRAATTNPLYDLNGDSVVNDLDRQTWVHYLKQTFFGDADLNVAFDSADLVRVLASGEYEDDTELNSSWLTGDWDGDGDFTSGDLVVALADGGYEAGALAVPEPTAVVLTMAIASLAVTSRRPKTRR
jgi:hypothetical protein